MEFERKMVRLKFIFVLIVCYGAQLNGQLSKVFLSVEQELKLHFDDHPVELQPNWNFVLGGVVKSKWVASLSYNQFSYRTKKGSGQIVSSLDLRAERLLSLQAGKQFNFTKRLNVWGKFGLAYLSQTRRVYRATSYQPNLHLGYFSLAERKGLIGLPVDLQSNFSLAPNFDFFAKMRYVWIFEDFKDVYIQKSSGFNHQVAIGIGFAYYFMLKSQ